MILYLNSFEFKKKNYQFPLKPHNFLGKNLNSEFKISIQIYKKKKHPGGQAYYHLYEEKKQNIQNIQHKVILRR